jgi:hypothetical protein
MKKRDGAGRIGSWVAVLALAGVSGMALAEVSTRGDARCTQWTKERAAKTSQHEESWITGYLTGLSVARNRDFFGVRNTSQYVENSALFAWMDNWCKENPQRPMSDGADTIFKERSGPPR